MSLEVSAPQSHGGLLSQPPLFFTPDHMAKPQGPAIQLLLWQVLQQLQSTDPSRHQCTVLMDELRTERMRIRQERARREEFEDEAYNEITKLRNEKKLSVVQADGIFLDLQVKKSRLESLEKQIVEERSNRLMVEVENEKCKVKVEQEREVNALLGQELGNEKEKVEDAQEMKRSLEQEIVKLESQLYEEKMAGMSAKRELDREKKHIQQLEQTLKNETMKRLAAEHTFFRQILELKNNISLLISVQDLTENSKQICDVIQSNLNNERDKVSKLKDELSDLRTDLFKLNIQLGFEKKTVVTLQDNLDKELNKSKEMKDEFDNKTKRITDLEVELKQLRIRFKEEKYEKEDTEKKLVLIQADLRREIDNVKKLKEELETEVQKVKSLEKTLDIANSTDHELHEQNVLMIKKVEDMTLELKNEKVKISTLKDKLGNQAREVSDLKKKLEVEKKFSEEEKKMRKIADKDLERVKHLYVKYDGSKGYSPLHRASEVCDTLEAKSLMKNGYSPSEATKGNSTWKTAVHLAVESSCIDLIQDFTSNSSLLNIWDENSATPLHWAARIPNLNVVRVLLDNGAAINAWDTDGKTPLDYAGSNSNNEVMKLLIDRGAILGSSRDYGTTTEKNEKTEDDEDYNYYY